MHPVPLERKPPKDYKTTMKKTVFLILTLIICLALTSCFLRRVVSGSSSISGFTYSDSKKYSVGDFTYRASDVDTVSVDYISGTLTIVQSGSKTLKAAETSSERRSDAQTMHWYLDGKKLRIKFCESGYSGTVPDKTLTLEIPAGIDLEIGVTSGDVYFENDLTAKNVNVGATSGDLHIKTLTADDFESGSTSGDTFIDSLNAEDVKLGSTSGNTDIGTLVAEEADFTSTSGNYRIKSASCADIEGGSTSGSISIGLDYCSRLRIGCTSGNVELNSLPAGGATVEYDKTSGTLHADGYTVKGGKMVYGNGDCRISVTTTSGNLTIR